MLLVLRRNLLLVAFRLHVEVLLRNALVVLAHISLRTVVLGVLWLLWILLLDLLLILLASLLSGLVLLVLVVGIVGSAADHGFLDETHSSEMRGVFVEVLINLWMLM